MPDLSPPVAAPAADRSPRSTRRRRVDVAFWLSVCWLIGLTACALLADLLPLGNPDDTTATIGVAGYARPDLFSANPLGTNGFGLDLLARSIYGARVSLLTVGCTVVVSLLIGGLIGMVAGYFRGWVDVVIGVFADATLVIPALVLLIAFAAVLGPPRTVPEAVLKSGLALAVVGIPTMIRLARANTLLFAQREFVTAGRAMGATHARILVRELLPNVALPLVSYAFIVAAVLIVAEGSLAFLGLGLQQPAPSWGNMIAEGGLRELRRHPHVPLIPGVFMFLTVFSLNIVGERARARWDPRDSQV
ncbi:ABC transporter permease [Micromonospora sp. LOL_023]|uniref:ABC transporter permease n=1 Tax=Micromonospora sp. LOL_023 TaxID=3345418 RepID=UPI003A877553